RKLPVAGDEPLVDAADRLGPALAPVPRVEEEIEIELVAADVLGEGRRRLVPCRPDRALVVLHPGNLDEAPLAPIELRAVGVAHEDLATDDPALDVDQALQGSRLWTGHARPPRAPSVDTARPSGRRRIMVGQDAPPR